MKDKFTVLVVDDERSNILALNHILKPSYEVLAAINGKSALSIAELQTPDLILLDIIMPDISGFEVLAELKRHDATRRIPVIFITGLDSIEDEEKGFNLGAVDYIIKPFHSAIVKARVKMQLKMVEYINRIEQLSMTDMLTNVLNKRGFTEHISEEWGRARREKRPLSVLMIDLDKFKKYNDTYGHLQGDIALQTAADIFRRTIKRPTDAVARFGGEEFVVLLPDTDEKGAMTLAEEIRLNVQGTIIEGSNTSITVSIGVNTLIPQDGDVLDDFVDGADTALYAAKHSGRNRVCCYTPELDKK